MEENGWYRLTVRVWPEVAGFGPVARLQAVMAMIPLLFLSPLAAVSLFWLVAITDWSGLLREWVAFGVITAVLLILNYYSFTLQLDFGNDKTAMLTSSLATMVVWAVVLVLGPSILWTAVIVNLVMSIQTAHTLRVYNENPVWAAASLMVQELGGGLFTALCAAAIYQAGGGRFPLVDLNSETWPPLILSTAVMILLPSLLLLPAIIEMNRLAGLADWRENAVRFSGSMILLSLFSVPFGILIALSLSTGGLDQFIFLLLGVILVNWLIYKFSQGLERQRRQNRELAHMERLSQALLQSSPDARELESILQEHLPVLFTADRVEVRLFPSATAVWPTFALIHPARTRTATAEQWEQLRQTDQSSLTLPHIVLPDERGVYGDAMMVKIQAKNGAGGEQETAVWGGIYLLRHQLRGQTANSLPTLQALAAQIGATLYRAQAYAETVQNQKMSQEMAFAGQIQASFLPKQIPTVKGWDMAATLVPARQTSGDFYDFVELGHGRIAFVVADVSDKGAGAALYMALTRTLLRTCAMQYPDAPARALQAANERIFADTESEQFVTLFYGVLETGNGRLTYVNAGHNPAYVQGRQSLTLDKTGIPLGMYEGLVWQQKSVYLSPGDLLVAYTDGIPEAINEVDEEFGSKRLLQKVMEGNGHRAAETIAATLESVQTFTGSVPQFDDMTLVVIKRLM
jgi:serine phosphatase RsbU (regulator of sigma subunit)